MRREADSRAAAFGKFAVLAQGNFNLSKRMWASFAALESLSFAEQGVEFMPPLLTQGDHDIPAIVLPFPALYCELSALHGVFDCLI